MSRTGFVTSVAILILLAVLAVSTAFAADGIQIARPLDGSTVREIVNILVPISSLPDGGFFGVIIDGQFRSADVEKSENGMYYVYRWDTKATYSVPNSQEQVPPRDGMHTIAVQAYESMNGKKFGDPKQITVYVSNDASKLMPASGLRLRYNRKLGAATTIHFKYLLNLKTIQGASSIGATLGQGLEGAEGVVRRTVEDLIPDGTALIRQKLLGTLLVYEGGKANPINMDIKSVYDTEDATGAITYMLNTTGSGTGVSIDLPNLPQQKVRIGDSWTHSENVFLNAISGKATTLIVTSRIDGLEWENGYPCVKIRTTFAGQMPIIFSNYFKGKVNVTEGTNITYFAYGLGKLVSSVTTAKALATVNKSVLNSMTQKILPKGFNLNPTSPQPPPPSSYSPDSGDVGGPPGMEEPGSPYNPGSSSSMSAKGSTREMTDIEMTITQVLEPAQ